MINPAGKGGSRRAGPIRLLIGLMALLCLSLFVRPPVIEAQDPPQDEPTPTVEEESEAPPQASSDEPYTDALGQTMTNDEAYRMQFNQVRAFNATLTDEMKCVAEYWADGPRSETLPGHWNALAHGISYRDSHTLDQDVKLYFALNGALFDASIAAWEAKRFYDLIRPISALRHLYVESRSKAGLDRTWAASRSLERSGSRIRT